MSLDLEKHLTFYGAYHSNKVNVGIHVICVPLILFSGFTIASNTGPLFHLPSWLVIPHLEPTLGTLAAFTWGGLYLLLEPVAGTLLALLCLGAAAAGNHLVAVDSETTTKAAIAVHVACWILQFVGHGCFEGRAPALLDNLLQAIFLAPLFVWLELMFALGYRPELQARVNKAVEKKIAEYKSGKEAKNGKAN